MIEGPFLGVKKEKVIPKEQHMLQIEENVIDDGSILRGKLIPMMICQDEEV